MKKSKRFKPSITGDSAALLARLLPGAEAQCEATPALDVLDELQLATDSVRLAFACFSSMTAEAGQRP